MKPICVMVGALLLTAGISGTRAAEDGMGAAERLYRDGHLERAAAIARALDSAEGWSLAAKATLVEAVWRSGDGEQADLLRQAANDAEAALALDSDLVDAHLQLAIAMGQLGDLQDPISAHLMGYGHKGKLHLDRALALAPDDPWAHALVGMWHLQIVGRANAELAEEFYGANEEEGVKSCREAQALAPDEPNLGFGCAVSMLELDPEKYEAEALALLDAIQQTPPRDEADRLVQAAAARVLDQVMAGEPLSP